MQIDFIFALFYIADRIPDLKSLPGIRHSILFFLFLTNSGSKPGYK